MNTRVIIQLSSKEKDRFAAYVKKEILQQMFDRIAKEHNSLEVKLQVWVQALIENSPEVAELKSNSGKIQYALGVLPSEINETISQTIEKITNNIFLKTSISRDFILVQLGLIPADYSDILKIKQSYFISQGEKSTGDKIPWFDWLLRQGNKIIFDDYHVVYYDNENPFSRTKHALMKKSGTFRIPPEFSGTEKNNLLTRALSYIPLFLGKEIDEILS